MSNQANIAGGMSQQDYYALIRGRLPDNHRKAGAIIDSVNRTYVVTRRDRILAESFNKFVVWITSAQRHELAGKGDAFYITGESGAGKTDIAKHLIHTHPVLQPLQSPIGTVDPCISISLPGPATLKVLALRMLRKAGYELDHRKQEATLWDELPKALQEAGVLFVHIDEFQHLFHPGCDFEGLVKYIKGLMNNETWPVSFIIGGMPSVRNIIINDTQAERRNNSFSLPAIDMSKQKKVVHHIITQLAGAAPMDVTSLLASDMPERIAHAANYQFGRICEVTVTGIQEAALAGDTVLARKHFAQAYIEHSDARGRNEMNPFISDQWAKLKPGYFILKPDSKKKREEDYDEYEGD